MNGKRITFYADLHDLRKLCESVEAKYTIHYYGAGRFENNKIPCYTSLLDEKNLGISSGNNSSLIRNYLIVANNIPLKVRGVAQRLGGVAYFVDQLYNPNSLIIRTGGLWENEGIIPSTVDTLSTNDEALTVFKEFVRQVRKFKRINSVAVGDSAHSLLLQGYRFTHDMRLPREQDLMVNNY